MVCQCCWRGRSLDRRGQHGTSVAPRRARRVQHALAEHDPCHHKLHSRHDRGAFGGISSPCLIRPDNKVIPRPCARPQGHCALELPLVTAVTRACGLRPARRMARATSASSLVRSPPISVLRKVAMTAGRTPERAWQRSFTERGAQRRGEDDAVRAATPVHLDE